MGNVCDRYGLFTVRGWTATQSCDFYIWNPELMIPRTPRRRTAILTLTLENPYRIELILDRFIRTEQRHNI